MATHSKWKKKGNASNLRCETSRKLWNKERECVKDKINDLETSIKRSVPRHKLV